MQELPERIAALLYRYNMGSMDDAARNELDTWVQSSEANRIKFAELTSQEGIRSKVIEMDRVKKLVWNKLVAKAPELEAGTPVFSINWQKYAVAAAVIILLGAGYWWFSHEPVKNEIAKNDNVIKAPVTDALPGVNRATLTLADGSQIVLDSAGHGVISQQGNTEVVKRNDGGIAYRTGKDSHELIYNTITTKRGEQYPLVLPDGTEVWLNAASSLKYPVAFTGKERTVELTGEAYFEVAKKTIHNANGGEERMPFTVKILTASGNGGEVNVLGTHFNINAYPDEKDIKTTLLEGSVKVSRDNAVGLLKPGQQAISGKNAIQIVKDADTEEAVAWKNGRFQFGGAPIEAIMRQLSRWYDVDIVYEGKVTQRFVGEISRNVPASKVFRILEETGRVKFSIENKKIIVSPVAD